MDNPEKEVYFDKYCKRCRHEGLAETSETCDECLSYPTNVHSHKPVNWEEKE